MITSPRLLVTVLVLLGCVAGPVARAQDDQQQRYETLAKSLLEQGNVNRGVATVIGADTPLVLELARHSELLIHVRDANADAVAELKSQLRKAGIGIDRVVVEHGATDTLPFADNMIDLVVATQSGVGTASPISMKEVIRALRPAGRAIIGKALVNEGGGIDLKAYSQRARAAAAIDITTKKDVTGSWLVFAKAPLDGVDEWSHWEHSPDNNPVSTDSIIRAPYMTQFLADPKYIGMPSITTAAGGRTFLAIGHISHHKREWELLQRLIARNGYNGQILWERKLPEDYLVHRSAFIATKKTFFLLEGASVLKLDSQTGEEQGRIRIPNTGADWKWMVKKGNVLFVMGGAKERGTRVIRGDREFGGWSWADLSPGYYGQYPYGFGKTLAAYDLVSNKVIWTHNEDGLIDSRSLALRDGKLYFMCLQQHLRAISEKDGEIVWTNSDKQLRNLIGEPGKGLTSTPGFKTMCLVVATPDALIIQGQTRQNVVAVSTKDGYVLWTKRKITNNPNAVFINGNIILGVGKRGSHVVVNPVTGEELEDLGFLKRACTRLTASVDSLFVRGEGTLRYDLKSKRVMIDGTARPGCNDGALPANGMLYIGPWQCDCNLSIIGNLARCSAGDFKFDYVATEEERLQTHGDLNKVAAFEIDDDDWTTLRGGNDRSSSSTVAVRGVSPRWKYTPASSLKPVPAVTAGGLAFLAGDDGRILAVNLSNGQAIWEFATSGPIKASPTVWEGRVYVGSGDGYAYCLEAATGELLWRFRAAPIERNIMVFGHLTSTWPVNTGVMIEDGIAYFGAGIIDHDGTYIYAVDAKSGQIKWQNNSSGHLAPILRKGVSIQGNLAVLGDQLLLAGGNQVSPAPFNIKTGELNAKPFAQGQPKANNGSFVGVFNGKSAIVGGRILYSAVDNVATKGSYVAFTDKGRFSMNYGGVPPAWNSKTMVLVNFKHGSIQCYDAQRVLDKMDEGLNTKITDAPQRRRFMNLAQALHDEGGRWESNFGESNKFEAVSLVVCPNAVVTVVRNQQKARSQPQWYVAALNIKNGNPIFRHELRGDPLPGGLLIGRDGQIIVTMIDGSLLSFAPKQ
jgi:outer membrane protein assembly factor BamB